MVERIIIAGAGGQGIMLLGKVLAEAAMRENKQVTWLPAYGAEVRGGTANCTVIISDSRIGSPCVDKADTLILMNEPSLEKFKGRIKEKGLMILNSSTVGTYADKKASVVKYPFTEIAAQLGNPKVANMVALGAYVAHKKTVRAATIERVFAEIAPKDKKGLIEINKLALEKGIELS